MTTVIRQDRPPTRGHQRRQRCGGFTLVELMVVLLIASLLAAVALPALSGAVARAELRGTVGELAAALRDARSQAISKQKPVSLLVEIEERRFGVAGAEKTHVFDDDLEVRLLTGDLDPSRPEISEVRFFPDGTSTGGRITVTRGPRGYVVRVDWLTGRVIVRDKEHETEDG